MLLHLRLTRLAFYALALIGLLALLPLTGCASRVAQAQPTAVVVATAPPAPRVGVRPIRPSRVHVWIPGHWAHRGHRYVWVRGHWTRPPRARAAWVPGHWTRVRGGYQWVPGHWR
ncbi:MAG: BcpO-related WXXGXW repeat protein [Rhodothermaceae bacterium]|nr:BcpO-related WXXGXW repeat protein [Rhodothermaceae bacterium]